MKIFMKKIFMKLRKARREFGLRKLARKQQHQMDWLHELGQFELALKVDRDLIETHRRLAEEKPSVYLPHLADNLIWSADLHTQLSRHEDALAANLEAVEINRALTRDNPNAMRPHLALSLGKLGARFNDLERWAESCVSSGEALGLFRTLAADQPDVNRVYLASVLHNLAYALSALERWEEASAPGLEAIALHREIAADDPARPISRLADGLTLFCVIRSEMGHLKEGLAAGEEAIALHRALAETEAAVDPDRANSGLAGSLYTFAVFLNVAGRHEEAVRASKEAKDIYAKLSDPSWNDLLEQARYSTAYVAGLAGLNRFAEAAAAAHEALDLIAPRLALATDAERNLADELTEAYRKHSGQAQTVSDPIFREKLQDILDNVPVNLIKESSYDSPVDLTDLLEAILGRAEAMDALDAPPQERLADATARKIREMLAEFSSERTLH